METKRYSQELQLINTKPDRREAIRQVRIQEDLLRKRHEAFSKGIVDIVDLTSFDLRPQTGFVSNSPLQVIFNESELVGVNYEDIYTRFFKNFSKDVMDVSTGIGRKRPEPKTKRLREFILGNPFADLGYTFFAYTLKPDSIGLRFLLIERYFGEIRFAKGMSEIWTETRL